MAAEVGIRRAVIFYHFEDEQALFRAVQRDVFGGLLARVEPALTSRRSVAGRIEAGIGTWIDYVVERPSRPRRASPPRRARER